MRYSVLKCLIFTVFLEHVEILLPLRRLLSSFHFATKMDDDIRMKGCLAIIGNSRQIA